MKPDTAELYEQELTRRMRAKFGEIRTAIICGDAPTTTVMCHIVGDFLSDDNAMAELIRAALSNSHAIAGAHIARVVSDLIEHEAMKSAEAQLAQIERDAKQDPDQIPMRRRFDNRAPP